MKAFLTFTIILCFAIITQAQDMKIVQEIPSLLKDNVTLSKLHYPKSVARFYARNNSEYAWITGQRSDQSEMAMLLLEYSYRFGLSLSDYHWDAISLQKLRKLRDTPAETSEKEKALFDILMTDALITFINNLHLGKYNPFYDSSYIDSNDINGFRSEDILMNARQQKDFLKTVLEVQPKIKEYTDFQNYLNTLYSENDCIAPQREYEKIIINMERLRWIDTKETTYILVNIPSYTLKLYHQDDVFDFKVIVGKPSTKTPVLRSKINYFTTAPDWKVPQSIFIKEMLPKILKSPQYLESHHYSVYDKNGNQVEISSSKLKEIRQNPHRYSVKQSSGCDNALGAVVFRFENSYGIYLHDTSQKQLFNKDERALSHGCIRVESAKELASLMLKNDGSANKIPVLENAMTEYKRKDFVLKQPVPIIITYLTCLIVEGKPVLYKDIYDLDNSLEINLTKINNQIMRTILVPTDYSKPAKNAAFYALHLANALKSNIDLCHAFGIPVESPMLGQTAWSLYEYPALQEEHTKELKKLAKALEDRGKVVWGDETFPFHPSIYYACEGGDAVHVINNMAADKKPLLIVMGMQGAGMLTRFLFGSNSIKMIENTKYPLLLVPLNHRYNGLNKIAFATDLNKKDIKTAQLLIEFAKYFDAELLITHIIQSNNDVIQDADYEHKKEVFLKNLNGKICYNCIYSENIDYGLEILKHKDIDMLVMGHHDKSFFKRLFLGSHATRQASELEIPLLTIPENGNIHF